MREHEFRHVIAAIIAPEKATDQYISRLFLAFATDDKKTITFQDLIECLSLIQPRTAESNAQWTIRIITGCQTDRFAFPEFLSFTKAVFGLNEGKSRDEYEDVRNNKEGNKETVEQRATTIFKELDSNGDGYVTLEDMTRFFEGNQYL
ncbi:EF hand [Oesophagostomum dentatum]|uniref:EF hand n=1 Tax=Oesophagostomum dentatum TaxID=61180 RepID=A0A0B1SR52_OESDE|nr:EF hand [Oesophagostomum dentatum]